VAAVALPLAWLAAMVMAQLTVRPIRAIVGQVDRIRRGEPVEPAGVVAGGDEFQELSAQLSRLGRELQADRLATLSEKAHLQQVVDQLEDGVIFLNPERRVLFMNRVAEGVVGLSLEQTVGLAIHEVLDPAHPLLPFIDQVIGGTAGIHSGLFAPADTLASRLASQYAGAANAMQTASLAYLAVLLLIISVITNFIAQIIVGRVRRNQRGPA